MNFDLVLFGLTAVIVYNIYVDNQLLDQMMSYHKYYKMVGVLVVSVCIYRLWRWAPNRSRNLLAQANSLIRTIPVASSAAAPAAPVARPTVTFAAPAAAAATMTTGGVAAASKSARTTKRVVSETKKKFVAARQGWKCHRCRAQLSHTFEVDHVRRLDAGGTNEADNLVAMCRECHGYKTSMENM